MPLGDQLDAFFTHEWERFKKGTNQLTNPDYDRERAITNRDAKRPDEGYTINIPGWDDVVRLGPRYRPTTDEIKEYYDAQRRGRTPNISQEARDSIDGYRRWKDAARTSAQEEWAKGWGHILTAIDNVQDFASTLSTLGRLALWSGPRAAAGLEALFGLGGALTTGGLAKLGGRFVPILGGAILVSDVLNLAALLGTVGMFGYGILCKGPSEALAAGAPALFFKRALKNELWNAAKRNPFGRAARLDAARRAVGKLPGFGNLVEVAQTTEQLFGIGASFGSIVGMLMDAAFGAEKLSRGESVSVNVEGAAASWTRLFHRLTSQLSTAELQEGQRAARVMATAPTIMSGQAPFDEYTHLLALAAYLGAAPMVWRLMDQVEWEPVFEDALSTPFAAPVRVGDVYEAIIEQEGDDLGSGRAWALPGSPARLTGADLVHQLTPRIASGVRRFIERRNDGVPAVLFGTMVGQITEASWLHMTRDPHALKWELTPPMKILSDMCEDGWLIAHPEPDPSFRAWWAWMLEEHKRRDRRAIPPELYTGRATAAGVRRVKLLPSSQPYPAEWSAGLPR